MSGSDQYSLNWSNHTAHVKKAFDSLLASNEFTDVTLACEGKKIGAHKMLLSACSTYFHDLFKDNPCQHPIVILKDVKYQHLLDILKFVYNGEVSVSIDTFETFLKTAEVLQISGLTDDDNRFTTTERDNTAETPPKRNANDPTTPVSEGRLTKRKDIIEKPVTRKSDHHVEVKWKNNEKVVQSPVSPKKRKSNSSLVKELVIPKKEKRDVSVSEDEQLEITKEDPDTDAGETDNDDVQMPDQQPFSDVDDLLDDAACTKTEPGIWVDSLTPHVSLTSSSSNKSMPVYNNEPEVDLFTTHIPTHIPRTERKQYPTRNCRYCPGRRETRWECVTCGNVALHKDVCFANYHLTLQSQSCLDFRGAQGF